MNILVIGGGGREHTIAWKIRQNPDVKNIYCIPGNAGIAKIAECHNLNAADFPTLATFVEEKNIDFTIVGPEQPLVNGIVDFFRSRNYPIFGPNQEAAQMEGSKIFSKRLMAKYGIPTAAFAEFDDPAAAIGYLKSLPNQPIVVKADGLAAGKGSVVCKDTESALTAVDEMMNQRIFDLAGSKIVIEECMTGEEVSLFILTDGSDYIALTPAQDFKRALDNDLGKNTGGMGSYSPTPFLTEELRRESIRKVVEPTLSALQSEGIDYTGVLYCGLMLTPNGPSVIEYNCRFGDPETQVVLPLLNSDLLEIAQAVERREVGKLKIDINPGHAASVVMASGGYPEKYETGKIITGLPENRDDLMVFHAGTKLIDEQIVTSGGRVLAITALSRHSLKAATEKAYEALADIKFEDAHFRTDIARRAWHI